MIAMFIIMCPHYMMEIKFLKSFANNSMPPFFLRNSAILKRQRQVKFGLGKYVTSHTCLTGEFKKSVDPC